MKIRYARLILLVMALTTWAGFAELVEITILHTTDIHAYVGNLSGDASTGDWLRLGGLIEQERRAAGGAERVVLIDTGDTVQGSLVGAVSQGAVALPLLEALRYDAWVPGNHELDFGIARLRELVRQAKVPVLAGNLRLEDGPELAAWRLVERGGARIAIIGMTIAFLPNWFVGPLYDGYHVEPAVVAIERLMPAVLRAKPDMIVLGIHQGFQYRESRGVNEVRQIALRFPQINLILGGHTHQRHAGMSIGSSWYVQPEQHATELGRIVVRLDTKQHRVVDIKSTLVPVPEEMMVDDALRARVAPWLEQAAAVAAEVIAVPPVEISSRGTPGISCHMSDVICQALAARTGAVAALHGRLSRAVWPAGEPITGRAIFQAIPYENYTCVAWLTKAELSAVVAEQLSKRSSYTFNGIWGVHVVANRETGEVIELRAADGQTWPEDERRPVAFTSYNAAGGGGRYPLLRELGQRPETRLTFLQENSRDTLRHYLQATTAWHAPPRRWLTWQ